MDAFFKLAAILFVCCVVAILCGMLTTAAKEGEFQNCTPVTLTVGADHSNIKEVPITEPETKKACEKENTTEQVTTDMQPVEMTDESSGGLNDTVKEQMQEQELEQLNNESDTVSEDQITDGSMSTDQDDGLVSLDNSTDEGGLVVDAPIKESCIPSVIKKTVNASGFIFLGTKYAGEEVEIRVK